MICKLQEVVELAQQRPPTRVAVAAAAHKLVLESVRRAVTLGLIVPLLVGREEDIRQEAAAIGWELTDEHIVPTETNRASATAAVQLARAGEAQVVMKGYLHTDEMLHAVLERDRGLRTDRLLSHVFVLEVPTYPTSGPTFPRRRPLLKMRSTSRKSWASRCPKWRLCPP